MQYIVGLIFLIAGAGLVVLNLYTTWLCLKHYRFDSHLSRLSRPKKRVSTETGLPPISILKPLKGADNGLIKNLESFFLLDYPEYELIFSIADPQDPSGDVVLSLIAQQQAAAAHRHTIVHANLIAGDVEAGPNPKVNNLIRSYQSARHDLILISDSNIRVDNQYLRQCVDLMKPGVGVVTATVTGQSPKGLGARLEGMYLNTFYARWMVAANVFGFPTVLGKSMLFSKTTAERFGGIQSLSRYLAEDYIAGQAMRHLGLSCKVMREPVPQVIGHISLKNFWQRQIRWGRMRKNMQLFAWSGELISGPVGSAALAAIGFKLITGSFAPRLLAIHWALWFFCDFLLMLRLRTQMTPGLPFYWLARELLSVPMWLHTLCGNTVLWRGNRFRIQPGGVLAPGKS